MNWYEDGALAVNRCMDEDRVQVGARAVSQEACP